MKRYVYLALLFLLFYLPSCSITLSVSGTPNTEIYAPEIRENYSNRHDYNDYRKLGTIDQSGIFTKRFKNSERYYYPFLLAKPQGSDKMIPFAPNIEKDSRQDWNFIFLPTIFGTVLVPIINSVGYDYYFQYTPTQTNEDLFSEQVPLNNANKAVPIGKKSSQTLSPVKVLRKL